MKTKPPPSPLAVVRHWQSAPQPKAIPAAPPPVARHWQGAPQAKAAPPGQPPVVRHWQAAPQAKPAAPLPPVVRHWQKPEIQPKTLPHPVAAFAHSPSRQVVQMMKKSGRSTSTQWNLFSQYAPDQAKQVVNALYKAGFGDVQKALKLALKQCKLPNLPAHGTGQKGDNTQGNFAEVASEWTEILTTWAKTNAPKDEEINVNNNSYFQIEDGGPSKKEIKKQNNFKKKKEEYESKENELSKLIQENCPHEERNFSGYCRKCNAPPPEGYWD